MSEFSVKKTVENNLEEIKNCSKKTNNLADDTNRIASELSEWGKSYSGIIRRLKALSNDVSKDGKSLQTFSEAGIAAIRLYFDTEQKLCNSSADDVARVSASSSKKSQKEIDNYIRGLYNLLAFFLSLFHAGEITRNKWERILAKYWQMLYDENGIEVTIIPPAPINPEPEQPAQEPEQPAQEPEQPAQEPEQPAQEPEQPAENPPEDPTPPQPVTPEEDPGPDRTPNYSNKLFDNKGRYGARQRLPKNDKDIYEVIRMFYPDWTDKQCKALINRLGPEGCGYAACANAILYAYEGRAEEFESVYGISMYKNGDLNYDELVMYLYTAYDQDTYEGITPGEQGDIITDMMQMGGHTMEAEYFYETTPDQVPDDLNKGLLTFATQGSFDITPVGGGKTLHFDEAHVMTVTGVASDGRLIVSTWGGKYYIDPATCKNPYYTLFKFDTRGNI